MLVSTSENMNFLCWHPFSNSSVRAQALHRVLNSFTCKPLGGSGGQQTGTAEPPCASSACLRGFWDFLQHLHNQANKSYWRKDHLLVYSIVVPLCWIVLLLCTASAGYAQTSVCRRKYEPVENILHIVLHV